MSTPKYPFQIYSILKQIFLKKYTILHHKYTGYFFKIIKCFVIPYLCAGVTSKIIMNCTYIYSLLELLYNDDSELLRTTISRIVR